MSARTLRRLAGFMPNSVMLAVVTAAVAVGGTVMQVVTPKMLGDVTTSIFDRATGTGEQGSLGRGLLVVVMLYLGTFLATFAQQRLLTVISLRTTEALRGAARAKLDRLPMAYFDRRSTGDLMSIAVNDIDNIAANLQQGLTQLVSSVVLAVGMLAFMLTISPVLTLLACLTVPVGLLALRVLTPAARRYNRAYQRSLGLLNGTVEETFQNFLLVKSLAVEDQLLTTFRASNRAMRTAGRRARLLGSLMTQFIFLAQNVGYVLIAAIGAVRVMNGELPIGDLQAFLQYSQQFASPVMRLSQTWGSVLSAIASAERVFELLDAEEVDDRPQRHPRRPGAPKVAFDAVRFGYGATPLMSGFTLEVRAGQTVAIVGRTGAGKTSLVNVLERFYEIQGGSIRIDGVDIRDLAPGELRRRMGLVLQDVWLFSGSILENIRYGNPEAGAEEVRAAAAAARADGFIERLPDGFDTLLAEDGGNLSQGQQQLLTIARAFVADPEILVLDEATSNVDSRTEVLVAAAVRKLMEGRTSFVIAHRLSTVQDADRIVVMEHGDVVETGTHPELLARGGTYADIYHSQFAASAARPL